MRKININCIGIKNSIFKKTLLMNIDKAEIVDFIMPGLAGKGCWRHFDLLNLFDSGIKPNDKLLCKTDYFLYYKMNKKSDAYIYKKINIFFNIYYDIKNNGYNYNLGNIVITSDGARLDGSHRSSIVEHLKYDHINVKLINWGSFFSGKKLRLIKKHVNDQKKKYGII